MHAQHWLFLYSKRSQFKRWIHLLYFDFLSHQKYFASEVCHTIRCNKNRRELALFLLHRIVCLSSILKIKCLFVFLLTFQPRCYYIVSFDFILKTNISPSLVHYWQQSSTKIAKMQNIEQRKFKSFILFCYFLLSPSHIVIFLHGFNFAKETLLMFDCLWWNLRSQCHWFE